MARTRSYDLIAENLSYGFNATRTLFEGINLNLSGQARIALVGENGIGKSTLLKILSGQIQATQGSVTCQGLVHYLPQINSIQSTLHSVSVLDFLRTQSDEWWEIEQILSASLHTTLDGSWPMQSLSGGELAKVFLAIAFAQSPDFLLLDEPTNHLDYGGLEDLRQMLAQFQGACVMVSHKPFFLDQVAQMIWELTPMGIQVYGGNFTDYQLQKRQEGAAQNRAHEAARKELKRAKAAALKEQQRAAQSHRNGRYKAQMTGLPRVIAGARKHQAEKTAAKRKAKHAQAIAHAAQTVTLTKQRTYKTTQIQLDANPPKRRNLVDIGHADLWIGNQRLIHDIVLQVQRGDRLSLLGPNGSGKSCFVQALLGMPSTPAILQGGCVQCTEIRMIYLDQRYDYVDRHCTVIQNLQNANLNLDYQRVRQQLGHFLFFGDDVHKPSSTLSGGELARLAIAMITIAEVDLLILDEPTNHLDTVTVDQMVAALNQYQGALWVISHDLDFLSRIHITHSFLLKDQRIQQTITLPRERSQFHDMIAAATSNSHVSRGNHKSSATLSV